MKEDESYEYRCGIEADARAGTRLSRRSRRCAWCSALREELGTKQGTVKRVADQLGIGIESVRGWVKQAEIDRGPAGTSGW